MKQRDLLRMMWLNNLSLLGIEQKTKQKQKTPWRKEEGDSLTWIPGKKFTYYIVNPERLDLQLQILNSWTPYLVLFKIKLSSDCSHLTLVLYSTPFLPIIIASTYFQTSIIIELNWILGLKNLCLTKLFLCNYGP